MMRVMKQQNASQTRSRGNMVELKLHGADLIKIPFDRSRGNMVELKLVILWDDVIYDK